MALTDDSQWREWLRERRHSLMADDSPAALDTVLLASDFAFEELRKRPALLQLLTTHVAAELQPPAADDPDLSTALRRFRRAESLSIVIDDVLGRDGIEQTLQRTTALAERCIEVAFTAARAELVGRHGEPRDDQGVAQPLIVYGLGKLGSRELNFSSDIDLIAAFPRAGETDGRRSLDNEDFFARLVQRASTLLGETTAEGFGYRVDWRLRPFGTAGRLALSFDAMEDYYQREGREWERFALLRARPVAGDLSAGRELLERLRPFVWRRYFDYAALEGLRELKAMVDAEVRRREREHDLKLGPGGIREIEFRVQLESIIRGGRDPALRTGNTLELLTLLAERGLIAADEALALADAYGYLRRLENRVQMYRDEQVHVLPDDPETRERYALALNYDHFSALMIDLDYHRTLVSAAFERCLPLASGGTALPASHDADVQLWRRFAHSAEQGETRAVLTESTDLRALNRLAETAAVRAMSARGRARLDRIVPLVLSASRHGAAPEQALERWIDLLAAVAGRTSYLALLAERPALIDRVHQLLLASAWLARALAQSPILLDDLIDTRLAADPITRADFGTRLDLELAAVDAGDTEHELERVRQFQQSARLELALALLDGRADAGETARGLADIADLVIDRLLRIALRDLASQHGALPGLTPKLGLAVIGYGSLGGLELNFSSDLDLVFVYDEELQNVESNGARVLDGQRYLARAAQRLLHLLTVQTAFGPLYEIDARLRPNGSKGLLVTPLSAYSRYQASEAWLWEHQALVRARFVAGDPALGTQFAALRMRVLLKERDALTVEQEVGQMRERWREALDRSNSEHFDIKQGHGGLVDIEFIAQQILLSAGHRSGMATSPPTETNALLRWLADHQLLDRDRAEALATAHTRMLDRGLRCALALEQRVVPNAEALNLAWRG